MSLSYTTIQQAWDNKDPALIDYIIQLANQGRPEPEQPIRDEALTFDRFLYHITTSAFLKLSDEEKYHFRKEQLALLEADDAEVPLAESLKLYKIILLLWADKSHYARTTLLQVIQKIPLVYGPWKAIKHIYKISELNHDYELLGQIAARIDSANAVEITPFTITYMKRRAWRYLRKLGESFSSNYANAAAAYLAAYTENTQWGNTWVANHIFYHNTKAYGRGSFSYISSRSIIKNRAFAQAWKHSPEPLLRLLSLAQAEKVRRFATEALKADFSVPLRNLPASELIQLMSLPHNSIIIDEFIVWLVKQATQFEQHQFRELGLHQGIVSLLHSESKDARQYACDYVRAHARDLPLDDLLLLANNSHNSVRKLAQQLISERDPRNEIGLDAWGQLLEAQYAYDFAKQALIKFFGKKELTPDWFAQRLLSCTPLSFKFCSKHLLELHPLKTLGHEFFQEVIEKLPYPEINCEEVAEFALEQLHALGIADIDSGFLQAYLLHSLTQNQLVQWIHNDDIKLAQLPIDYCKALSFEPDWDQHADIQALKNRASWKNLGFDEEIAETMQAWLSDVRRIAPSELGFDWLMQLINHSNPNYHRFASELMIKAYLPADFANSDDKAESAQEQIPAGDINIDLEGQTFLFTGKLQTMTRKEAQGKVTQANGKNSSGVTGKLNYLVIGDEGSPMYGNGKKGSKQLKAESLAESGSPIKIISETAFLKMLAGEEQSFSEDSIFAGCENLWQLATENPDTPVAKFARKYLRRHHPKICLETTDRPVDPGAEIPEDFLSFERFNPLLQHSDASLRGFALEFSRWEMARWSPSSADIIKLCESPHSNVKSFITTALLSEPEQNNQHYRLDAGQLDSNAVFSFCESSDDDTRQLGLQIIQQHEKFQSPEQLFPLTESQDRRLRAFVVRQLWAHYRHYATTSYWTPRLPDMAEIGKKNQQQLEKAKANLGKGLPKRPKNLPANHSTLQQLLKRWLYELPPGRLSNKGSRPALKPLSASSSKKALIETFRDLAVEDIDFARLILPLLQTFTRSNGTMEQAACLVAVTRIQAQHPQLIGDQG